MVYNQIYVRNLCYKIARRKYFEIVFKKNKRLRDTKLCIQKSCTQHACTVKKEKNFQENNIKKSRRYFFFRQFQLDSILYEIYVIEFVTEYFVLFSSLLFCSVLFQLIPTSLSQMYFYIENKMLEERRLYRIKYSKKEDSISSLSRPSLVLSSTLISFNLKYLH